jgi:hypothetical protein
VHTSHTAGEWGGQEEGGGKSILGRQGDVTGSRQPGSGDVSEGEGKNFFLGGVTLWGGAFEAAVVAGVCQSMLWRNGLRCRLVVCLHLHTPPLSSPLQSPIRGANPEGGACEGGMQKGRDHTACHDWRRCFILQRMGDVWNEVWDDEAHRWRPFRPLSLLQGRGKGEGEVVGGAERETEGGRERGGWEEEECYCGGARGKHVMAHVVAVEEGCVRDVTRRLTICMYR